MGSAYSGGDASAARATRSHTSAIGQDGRMNSELLAGKTALVTGSSRGIGREIAIAFVEAATNAYNTGQIVSVNGRMYFTS